MQKLNIICDFCNKAVTDDYIHIDIRRRDVKGRMTAAVIMDAHE